MSFATTDRVNLSLAKEASWGADPDGSLTLQKMRFTGQSLTPNKQDDTSKAIRGDRRVPKLINLGEGAGGGFNFELALGEQDDLLGSAIGHDAAVTLNATATDISATATTKTISSIATDITAGLSAGMFIRTSGFATAGNNAIWRVSSVSGSGPFNIVVEDPGEDLVDEPATESVTISTKTYRDGSDKVAWFIEAQYADISNVFLQFLGMVPSEYRLTFNSRSIVTGSVGFMGKRLIRASTTGGDGSPIAASTATPISSGFTPGAIGGYTAGAIMEGGLSGSALTAIQTLEFVINANTREQTSVTSKGPIGIGLGRCAITGTARVYMEDASIFDDYLAHTLTSLLLNATDPVGKVLIIDLPAVRWTGNVAPEVGGHSQDVFLPLQWSAEDSTALGYQVQVAIL